MPLTRDFKDTVDELLENPEFRKALLQEIKECSVCNGPDIDNRPCTACIALENLLS